MYYNYNQIVSFETFKGLTLTSIDVVSNDKISFTTECGKHFIMTHIQDCCENVYIEDICGDLSDLLNEPILVADEVTNSDDAKNNGDESWTWTFYKLRTRKGDVTIRWYGTSNGYYSEAVSLLQVDDLQYQY